MLETLISSGELKITEDRNQDHKDQLSSLFPFKKSFTNVQQHILVTMQERFIYMIKTIKVQSVFAFFGKIFGNFLT